MAFPASWTRVNSAAGEAGERRSTPSSPPPRSSFAASPRSIAITGMPFQLSTLRLQPDKGPPMHNGPKKGEIRKLKGKNKGQCEICAARTSIVDKTEYRIFNEIFR